MVRRIGPVQEVSSTASVSGSVYRNELIPSEDTGGITVVAADTNLLHTLAGSVHAGSYLNRATSTFPVVVLGSVAAQRLGVTSREIGQDVSEVLDYEPGSFHVVRHVRAPASRPTYLGAPARAK